MKRVNVLVLVGCLVLLLSLFGCTNKEEPVADYMKMSDFKTLTGYIVLKNGKILLIQGNNVNKKDLEAFTLQEIIHTYNERIFIGFHDGIDSSALVTGVKVKVWYDMIQESDPPQTTVLKFELLEN
ncbi:DUF3221 domain-containing protein [Priestia taiwanensis]|uniref:DUF3221 domain-containing protein n=1 Tax=Priestia taiwanensis TaxID=1347902 RepID=A0A917AJR8_9BACI|nr:DUF3221 domain-containing protein [Priestia taiwanensis]MBM7361828.1 hypothetical protein [Priestia taiwanensis]GGE57275.1 hypothetical protein GCM10007140_04530 [Priestia taiwanensis]